MNASEKCEKLWDEMRKADFRNQGILNEKNLALVYEKTKSILHDLLKITSSEDFFFIFDEDSDGFLNEDEQIMIFTIIKERIHIIAEELCAMQKYELYKDLMREIRTIEGLINTYQNELRQNLHNKQFDDYISIGYEMQNEFNDNWGARLAYFLKKSQEEEKTLIADLNNINDLLYQREANKIHLMKLKPLHQIELLTNQEKLVAINERVEEAANFRNELTKLIKKDRVRLEKKKNELIKNLNNKIEKEEKMEIKKKKDLIDKEKNKLMIKRNKETDILNKQINLHLKDIVRIQNSISNVYKEKGKSEDELRRLKERQRNTNKKIASFKSIKSYTLPQITNMSFSKHDLAMALLNIPNKNISLSMNTSLDSNGLSKYSQNLKKINVLVLKFIMRNYKLTRFDINSEFHIRKFCNVPEDYSLKNDNNLKKKIRKLLDQRKHKDEILIPPSYYYDYNLNIMTEAKNYRDLIPKLGSEDS